jgi:cobalt-zinc-cadmium efflux system outer membrane protein
MQKRLVLIWLATAGLGGCAGVDPDAGFTDVQKLTQDRIGQRIQWLSETGDPTARKLVDELLAKPLTADAAVQIALVNNAKLQATYERLGIAQAEVVQAGLLSNPVVDAAVKLPIDGGSTKVELGLAVSFLELLYLPMRKHVVEARFEAAKARVAAEVIDLAARTRSAFYRVQADEQVAALFKQVVESTSASADVMRRLHAAGNVRDLDLHNEQLIYEQARLDLSAAQAAAATHREELTVLMGLWGDRTVWHIQTQLAEIPVAEAPFDDLEKRAVADSLELAALRAEIDTAGRSLGLAKASSLLPDFKLGPTAERDGGDWFLGPAVAVPIPLFDQGQARTAEARATLRRQSKLYAAAAVEVRSAVRAAAQQLVTARQAALHFRDVLLPLRQKVVHETMLEYNAMQVGVFQLLDSKRQQIETARRSIEALHGYWQAKTRLETVLAGHVPSPFPTPSMASDAAGASMNTGAHE